MYENRLSVVVLSRGGTWAPRPQDPPYLIADPGLPWPAGATATARFYDTKGAQIGSDIAGTVTTTAISFDSDPAVVDLVPNGANFEVFLTDSGTTYQIRHGRVVRREASFFDSPAVSSTFTALQFTDTFPTLGLRSSWKPMAGTTIIHDNSGVSLPNGAGPAQVAIGEAQSSIRWYAPLNGNSVRVKVKLLNRHNTSLGSDFSHLNVILCAAQDFSTWIGVRFTMSDAENGIRFETGTGPLSATLQTGNIANSVADNDEYTIYYDDATATTGVYKGVDTTPLGTWTDSSSVVPHGPGYTYTGIFWDTSQLSDGLQLAYWSAKDDV